MATEPTHEEKLLALDGLTAADAFPQEQFEDWSLGDDVLKGLSDMGYTNPTRVQQAVYHPLEKGRDVMVQSHTGSGKTAAFGIPLVQNIDARRKGPQALILAPTRELAMQVAAELEKIAKHKDIKVIPIYGGASINKQIDELQAGAQVIAGTPGRVMDHIKRKTMNTADIGILVLDECDEMLSMGFQEDIEAIIKLLPDSEKRQTLLFSATIPGAIERIGRRYMNDPEMIQLSSDSVGVDLIDHFYYVVSGIARTRDLWNVIRTTQPESAIIFCNTRDDTNTVAKYLTRKGFEAAALSSDLSQKERERVMARKRNGELRFLVATDIAARGIDISDLSHVINYTFPESAEVYVHRTGRTGRAGKGGVAISLIGPQDIGSFYNLKLIYKILPEERSLPSKDELAVFAKEESLRQLILKCDKDSPEDSLKLAEQLVAHPNSARLVATLVEQFLNPPKPPAPLPAPKPPVEARDDKQNDSSNEERHPSGRRRRKRPQGDSPREARPPRGRNERPTPSKSNSDETSDVASTRAPDAPSEESGDRPERKRRRRRRPRSNDAEAASTPTDSSPESDESSKSGSVEAKKDGEEKPRRQRQRKRRGPDAENQAKADTADKPNASAPKKSSKPKPRQKEKPKTTASGPTEFWEAWADEKPATSTTKEPEKKQKAKAEPKSDNVEATSTNSTDVVDVKESEKPKRTRKRRPRKSPEADDAS